MIGGKRDAPRVTRKRRLMPTEPAERQTAARMRLREVRLEFDRPVEVCKRFLEPLLPYETDAEVVAGLVVVGGGRQDLVEERLRFLVAASIEREAAEVENEAGATGREREGFAVQRLRLLPMPAEVRREAAGKEISCAFQIRAHEPSAWWSVAPPDSSPGAAT